MVMYGEILAMFTDHSLQIFMGHRRGNLVKTVNLQGGKNQIFFFSKICDDNILEGSHNLH